MVVGYDPSRFRAEIEYIVRLVLSGVLGLEPTFEARPGTGITLSLDGQRLEVATALFDTPMAAWLGPASLPSTPLQKVAPDRWHMSPSDLSGPTLPVLYGKGDFGLSPVKDGLHLGLDVFGSALFMLTRYEELAIATRDRHGRFPAAASLAGQEGFLHRPIVDEYTEVLWHCMRRLWPRLTRRPSAYQLVLTHDVDALRLWHGVGPVVRSVASALMRAKSPRLALKAVGDFVFGRADPYDTFDDLMTISEHHGLQSRFFVLSGGETPYDTRFLEDPKLRSLLQRIADRGHEVGIHPSYATATDQGRWKREFEALSSLAPQPIRGGRQHYLRWENPTTWRIWDAMRMEYDSSVGYADQEGFRAGTCRPYRVFDLRARQPLQLEERPLIAMDVTLASSQYRGLAPDQGAARLAALATECRRYRGDCTVLWHNSSLDDYHWPGWRRTYENFVAIATSPIP